MAESFIFREKSKRPCAAVKAGERSIRDITLNPDLLLQLLSGDDGRQILMRICPVVPYDFQPCRWPAARHLLEGVHQLGHVPAIENRAGEKHQRFSL